MYVWELIAYVFWTNMSTHAHLSGKFISEKMANQLISMK
jgi:hypothetical protein